MSNKETQLELERLAEENRKLKAQLARSGKVKKKKLKAPPKPVADSRLQLAEFVKLLVKHKTREEIIDELGLNTNQFEAFYAKFFEEVESEENSKTPIKRYVEFVQVQTQLVRELEWLVQHLKSEKKNGQAYVAAIRTQSEIYEKIIKTGQELRLIVKAPESVLLVDGRDAREVDADELELEVNRELQAIRGLIDSKKKKGNSGASNVLAFRKPEDAAG